VKRNISVLLIIVMVLTLVNVSATAFETDRRENAKRLYAATGALAPKGSDDEVVTRGDFITCVTSALKFDLTPNDGKQLFADVKANSVNGKALEYALALGLTEPAKYFNPDESITYVEAAKILVTALGYGEEAMYKGGYPLGYVMIASREGLAKNISTSAANSISIGDFYILMRSFLEANLRLTERFVLINGDIINDYVERSSILEQLYGWSSFEGIINGDENTSLYDNTITYKDGLLIGDSFYKCNLKYTLGASVVGYNSDESGSDTVVFIEESKRNTIVYIPAAEVTGVSDGKITCYSKNGKDISYTLEGLHSMIYNGKACFDDLSGVVSNMATGGITLVDNDSDGEYDVCIVMDGCIMNVGNVNDYMEYLYDAVSGSSINLSNNSNVRVYQNGSEAYINSIKKGTVIEYYQSQDKKYTEINILGDSITGTLTGIGDEIVFIDDKEYSFSDYFKNYNLNSVNFNDKYTFVINKDGVIACVFESKATTAVLAYATGVGLPSKIANTMKIRLFNEMGELLTLETAKKVLVNDEKPASFEVMYNSFVAAGEQVIRYCLDSNGKINRIYTENLMGVFDSTVDSVNCLKRYNFKEYNTETKIYYKIIGYFVPHFTINKNTKIIVVDDADAVRSEEERFYIGSLSTWANDALIESNRLLAYNVDKSGAASILVYKENSSSTSVSLNSTKFGFISKVTNSLDSFGDRAYKVTICNNNTFNNYFIPADSKLAAKFTDGSSNFTLGIGDGIRYKEGSNARLLAIELDYDYDPVNPKMVLLASRDNYPVNFYYGTVNALSNTSMSIDLLDSSTGGKGYPVAFVFNKAYVWIFDTKNKTFNTARPSSIVSSQQSPGKGDTVVVRTYSAELKDVVVIR